MTKNLLLMAIFRSVSALRLHFEYITRTHVVTVLFSSDPSTPVPALADQCPLLQTSLPCCTFSLRADTPYHPTATNTRTLHQRSAKAMTSSRSVPCPEVLESRPVRTGPCNLYSKINYTDRVAHSFLGKV